MRILYLVNEWAYFLRHRKALARAMADQGHEVIVASGEAERAPARIHSGAIAVERLRLDRHRFRPLGDVRLVAQIRHLLARHEPDVVHAITIKPILYSALAAASSAWRGRIVWTFPGLGKVFEPPGTGYERARRRLVASVLARAADGRDTWFTFENRGDRRAFVQARIARSDRAVRVDGTGLDLDLFKPAGTPDPTTDPAGKPTVLFASRLIRSKGIDTFLEAARSSKGDARFVVAGLHDATNPDAIDLDVLHRAHDDGVIDYRGAVVPEDMPALYREAGIAVLPTRLREGMPRSVLEAAACGTANVATDQLAIREIVQPNRTGWLVAPPSAANVAAAIGDALSDRDRLARMGLAARRLVESGGYGEAEVARSFERIYAGERP